MSRPPLRSFVPRFVLVLPCALALTLAACGGEVEGRGQGGEGGEGTSGTGGISGSLGGRGGGGSLPPIDHCAVASSYELQKVVDFEPILNEKSGTVSRGAACDPGFLSLIGQTKCGTGFNYDRPNTPGEAAPVCGFQALCTDTSSDISLSGTLPGDPIPANRCGEPGTALHVSETNVATCINVLGRPGWGSSIELNFTQQAPGTADLSAWDGISFWVRRNNPNTGATIIFLAVDPDTNGGNCISVDTNTTCGFRPGDPEFYPDADKCDPFSSPVMLRDEWTFVPIRFANMRQKGFGRISSAGKLDTTHIVRFQFLTTSGDWDFWIDDIALFRDP